MSRPVIQFSVIIFLSLFTIDFAISGDFDETYKSRLKGWEGVVFNCFETINIKNSVCASINADAEFLATASGINFSNEKEYLKVLNLQNKHNYLILSVKVELVAVSSTNTQCSTCALLVSLKAYLFYLRGINKSTPSSSNSPMAVPRSGDFVLWKQDVGMVFTGPWESGIGPTIKDVEKKLKEFFILFLKANPK